MQIICNKDNLIITITEGVVENEYGNLVADNTVMLGDLKVFSIDALPTDILPMKYCYTEVGGFSLNPNYIPTVDERLKESNERLALCEQALLDILGV